MRLGAYAVFLSFAMAGGACGSSREDLFTGGGAADAGPSSGGSGASGAGGVFATGGAGGGGGSSGTAGSGGSDTDGSIVDANTDTGAGGAQDSGSGGTGGGLGDSGGIGGSDGVDCDGTQCDPGERCCVPSNGAAYCAASGDECACTGITCTTTTMTCDSQSDCTGGEICCATVTYTGLSTYVPAVRCQASCAQMYTEYVLCDPNGPDICPGQTSCSQGILLSIIDVCQ